MGGDLLKKCIVQSIYFALYLALSYVHLNHSKPRKGISISNYVNTFFDFKYIV